MLRKKRPIMNERQSSPLETKIKEHSRTDESADMDASVQEAATKASNPATVPYLPVINPSMGFAFLLDILTMGRW